MDLNNVKYWQAKYLKNATGWDLGEVSPPLKTYFDSIEDKSIKILIPGAGNAYEAEYLYSIGFKNVYIVEWAPLAVENFTKRFPIFPKGNILIDDFFNVRDEFDLIIEQTFFCALTPDLRNAYVNKMHELLKPNGLLVGLLFQVDFKEGPPFGGNETMYRKLFVDKFEIIEMATALNSIQPRQGNELFVKMKALMFN